MINKRTTNEQGAGGAQEVVVGIQVTLRFPSTNH